MNNAETHFKKQMSYKAIEKKPFINGFEAGYLVAKKETEKQLNIWRDNHSARFEQQPSIILAHQDGF